MTVPMLFYDSRLWVLTREDVNNFQAAEAKFLKAMKKFTRDDRLYNLHLREAVNIFTMVGKIQHN